MRAYRGLIGWVVGEVEVPGSVELSLSDTSSVGLEVAMATLELDLAAENVELGVSSSTVEVSETSADVELEAQSHGSVVLEVEPIDEPV